jgi:superfamily II DNA/RNA helicase
VLTCFSPISKQKELVMPGNHNVIDLLIATDCISEGQNLQDCDYLINYDIHWNPVRIIQRFGRIDRIGSRNEVIQLVNFWPDLPLDDYINLKAMVETRMKISVMDATVTTILSEDGEGDLEYRKQQLRRLMDEVGRYRRDEQWQSQSWISDERVPSRPARLHENRSRHPPCTLRTCMPFVEARDDAPEWRLLHPEEHQTTA